MSEKSYYWDGLVTGDAVEAPYSSDFYVSLWKKLFTIEDNYGVIDEYLSELLVSGIAGGVIVASGAALVAGSFYENTADVTLAIPTPTVNSRIDRIVARKDWGAQTIRAYRIEGVEGAPPSAPAITQTLGAIWDTPLAQVLITTDGVITVTDEREFCVSPLTPKDAFILIEHQESSGTYTQFDFSDIPPLYDHLQIEFHGRHSYNAFPWSAFALAARFNGDAGANYNYQTVAGLNAGAGAAAAAGDNEGAFGSVPATWGTTALYPGQATARISNYRRDMYKTISGEATRFTTVASSGTFIIGATWLNTDPIDRVTIIPQSAPSGVFLSGSVCSLYGIRN